MSDDNRRHDVRDKRGRFVSVNCAVRNGQLLPRDRGLSEENAALLGDDQRIAILSMLADRATFADRAGVDFGNTTRRLSKVLGYKDKLTFADYLFKYERQDLAGKVIDIPPEDTWRKKPTLIDGEGDEESTALTNAFTELAQETNLFYHLKKVDQLSGIGQYGVLVLGLEGDRDLSIPVTAGGDRSLAYLRAYSQPRAAIKSWDTDQSSPRFGQPETYDIQVTDTTSDVAATARSGGSLTQSTIVHHSRIVHVAENTLDDDVFGTPRLRRVYDRLDDLLKIAGGSAEVFWLMAAYILHVNFDPKYKVTGMEDLDNKLQEVMRNNLRRTLQTQGAQVKAISGQTVDPRGAFEVQQQLIAAATGIPARILFGSERGELASSQDMEQWRGKIAGRQEDYAEPVILRPLVDRLIWAGVLPEATDGTYWFRWPPLFQLSPKQEAERAETVARALAYYAPGAAQLLIPPHEFRTGYLNLSELPPGMPDGTDLSPSTLLEELQSLREEIDVLRTRVIPDDDNDSDE